MAIIGLWGEAVLGLEEQGTVSKSRVALVRCDTYDDNQVYEAIRSGLDLLGGVSRFVKPGERIVLKPNVLIGSKPDKSVTTHPSVFKAVGRLFKEAGASVSYGDSPSFGKCEPNMRKSGLKDVGDELGLSVADFDSGRPVSHKDAAALRIARQSFAKKIDSSIRYQFYTTQSAPRQE